MNKLTTSLLIGTALFTAACAKKPPAVIPPAPGPSVVDPNAGQGGVAPGSRADFGCEPAELADIARDQPDAKPAAGE